ncbi:ion transporter [Nicoliella lavandulae]|uniref:Ion channel n=1 Tax=Nicoliella lavandulae TaxID=3082954 RepID=A0ABU8SM20_9LACO
MKIAYKLYILIMSLLALISVGIFILDYNGKINLLAYPWNIIDNSTLAIFAIDYFTRLIIAKDKWKFFRHNIFDLLAILPFDSFFAIFRITRVTRLIRLFKIMRMLRFVGVLGKFGRNAKKFLKTNGLIWVLSVATILILISSMTYSLAENTSFGEAVWWSITTTTTVGYGDISPQTPIGKVAAVILMFTGIGIIGILTSAITSYFEKDEDNKTIDDVIEEIKKLRDENKQLNEKIDRIEDELKK